MKFINNMRIGTRLLTGFIIVALIAGVLGITGIVEMRSMTTNGTELYKQNLVPLKPLNAVAVDFQRIRVALRDLILDNKDIKTYEDKINELQTNIDKNMAVYEPGISSEAERAYFESIKRGLAKYRKEQSTAIEYSKQNKASYAFTFLNDTLRPIAQKLDNDIAGVFTTNVNQAKIRSNDNASSSDNITYVMIIIIIIGVIIALGLGVLISRSISIPVKKLEDAADKLAVGDIDVSIESSTTDEIGNLMASFSKMISNIRRQADDATKIANGDLSIEVKVQSEKDVLSKGLKQVTDAIRSLIAEMDNMSAQHDAGDIDIFVSEDDFNGAYKAMAKGVNNMVRGHISVNKKAMACISEFAKGNFDAELEKFPGKKAFINENIEAMRKNLKDVTNEITTLIQASNEGKLSQRANSGSFQGDWSMLISGLNGLLDAIIEPIKEASNVLSEMAEGNLKVSVKGNYKGDHAVIKDALNNTISTLHTYVNEISAVLTEMANSNFVVSINSDYRGDFSEIKASLNLIIESFNNVLSDINASAAQVASAARQVSGSSQMLSQGSTEQASSIEELTASIEEISSQTNNNAKNANEANLLANNSKNDAVHGNEQMKEMLEAMEDINQSSGNISKIIKVIDDIAFQTNILALNAAVEAARAGQHGKGFAVVAEEVRNLAARSANAAKETTALIEGSIKKVENGTKIATDTAEALGKIVEGIAKATDLVADIAVASNEQAAGISQINQGLMQISQVVQTNSATSEESAAASEELSSQAEMLKDMVSRFKLKNAIRSANGEARLDSEMLNMLDNMNSRRKKTKDSFEFDTSSQKKIVLNDLDFGKY